MYNKSLIINVKSRGETTNVAGMTQLILLVGQFDIDDCHPCFEFETHCGVSVTGKNIC